MKKLFAQKLLFGFLVFIWSPSIFAQTTDELVESYSKAIGIANFGELKNIKFDGNITQSGLDMSFTSWMIIDKAVRTEVRVLEQKLITVFDARNNSGWTVNALMGITEPQLLTETEKSNFDKSSLDKDELGALSRYKQHGSKLEYVGKEKVEGIGVYHLTLTDVNAGKKEYYLTEDDFLLLKTSKIVTFNGEQYSEEVWFSDYRKTGGLYIPFTLQTKINNEIVNSTQYERINLEADIDATIFTFPK